MQRVASLLVTGRTGVRSTILRSMSWRNVLTKSIRHDSSCVNNSKRYRCTVHFQVTHFHSSNVVLKKKNNHVKEDGNGLDGVEVALPDISDMQKKVDRTLGWYTREMAKLRVGRASADMFQDLTVGSYGSLSNVGQVTLKNPSNVSVAVYDPSMVNDVSNAIRNCGLELNPVVDNSTVNVYIPKPSKESRTALVRAAGKLAEKVKQDIRHSRKDFLDKTKKCKGSVSDDDIKRLTKEVEQSIEQAVDHVSRALQTKEKDVMT